MIYILKLQNGKYYVGATSNLDKRLKDHMNGCQLLIDSVLKSIKIA